MRSDYSILKYTSYIQEALLPLQNGHGIADTSSAYPLRPRCYEHQNLLRTPGVRGDEPAGTRSHAAGQDRQVFGPMGLGTRQGFPGRWGQDDVGVRNE